MNRNERSQYWEMLTVWVMLAILALDTKDLVVFISAGVMCLCYGGLVFLHWLEERELHKLDRALRERQ